MPPAGTLKFLIWFFRTSISNRQITSGKTCWLIRIRRRRHRGSKINEIGNEYQSQRRNTTHLQCFRQSSLLQDSIWHYIGSALKKQRTISHLVLQASYDQRWEFGSGAIRAAYNSTPSLFVDKFQGGICIARRETALCDLV